jgi:hypothetical protein
MQETPPSLPDREPTDDELKAFFAAQRIYWDRRQEVTDEFWGAAQTVVVCAANISKLLWGSTSKAASARMALRDLLGISDSSPLAPRTVRNHLEHFDERLADWYERSIQSPNRCFVDRVIGISLIDIAPSPDLTDLFRTYVPSSGELVFWGDTLSIPDVLREAMRLWSAAQSEAEKAFWES